MSAVDIRVRAAGLDDAKALSTIGCASFRAAYEGTAAREDMLAHVDDHFGLVAVKNELATPGRHYLLASVADEPAGFVKIRDGARPAAIPSTIALELQQVYVLPAWQRHGVGGRLIESAAAFARERGADGLWLSVWEDAEWAITAYRKAGFTVVGHADWHLGSTVYADFLMWLAL